ncbi:hypothetical protein TNCV_3009861 [Trichonephila clavipes]|nr:hypothetical protein TNCV_3009861 [Trichonephila clavipes]
MIRQCIIQLPVTFEMDAYGTHPTFLVDQYIFEKHKAQLSFSYRASCRICTRGKSLEQYPHRCRDGVVPESGLTLGKWVSAAKDLPSCAPGDSFHRRTPRLPAQGRHFRRLLGLSARVPFPQPRRVRRFRKEPRLGGCLSPQSYNGVTPGWVLRRSRSTGGPPRHFG